MGVGYDADADIVADGMGDSLSPRHWGVAGEDAVHA